MDFHDPIERRKWLARLVASAKGHSRKAGRSFELTTEFIETLYTQQKGRCDVIGLQFNQQRFPDALVKHPFAPSIDRRLSSGEYTNDNVRLVCVAVNFGMEQWGEEVFLRLAEADVERERQRKIEPNDEWTARYRERIAPGEALLAGLPESERAKERRHKASLKRALTLGPHGLKAAANKAKRSRLI